MSHTYWQNVPREFVVMELMTVSGCCKGNHLIHAEELLIHHFLSLSAAPGCSTSRLNNHLLHLWTRLWRKTSRCVCACVKGRLQVDPVSRFPRFSPAQVVGLSLKWSGSDFSHSHGFFDLPVKTKSTLHHCSLHRTIHPLPSLHKEKPKSTAFPAICTCENFNFFFLLPPWIISAVTVTHSHGWMRGPRAMWMLSDKGLISQHRNTSCHRRQHGARLQKYSGLFFFLPLFGLGKLSCRWKTTFSTKCWMLLCSGPRTNTIQSWVKPSTVGFFRTWARWPSSSFTWTAPWGGGGNRRLELLLKNWKIKHCRSSLTEKIINPYVDLILLFLFFIHRSPVSIHDPRIEKSVEKSADLTPQPDWQPARELMN